jgi:hypothetical protein
MTTSTRTWSTPSPRSPSGISDKPDYDDSNLAIITSVDDGEVTVVFEKELRKDYIQPEQLADICENPVIRQYSFDCEEIAFKLQY